MVIFDSALPGTLTSEWDAMERLRSIPPLDLAAIGSVTVIAAHPDDETLGAGGLLAECSQRGIQTRVVVVTDGSASHPRSTTVDTGQLAVIRQRELFLAVSELSPDAEVAMLGFPDGATEEHRNDIAVSLERAIAPGSILVAPWRGDGHRDHRVVAEVCAAIATQRGSTFLEYPIWMWHWARADDERVPWERAVSLRLGHPARNAKRRALARHSSQVEGIGSAESDGPVLSPDFTAHFDRDCEMFLVREAAPVVTKSRNYFDAIYARSRDPWRMRTRWYEERKRAITAASLPRSQYESGLEIGCSVGELTATLASHCESLLAVDISPAAVSMATDRVAGLSNVRVALTDVTVEFPPDRFDLIVLSEVAYYWDAETLARVAARCRAHLTPGGTIVACHWRHLVDDYPLRGDEAQDLLRAGLALTRLAVHDEADFLLEVFSSDPRSVAGHEGLLG